MRQIPINILPPTGAATPKKIWDMKHPLWALGFRPFYLLAAAFAAVAIPLWVADYLGWTRSGLDLNWHMHEMVFGVVIAVVIGFLFTAARNWTELWTPRQAHLALLAALWCAGRIAMLVAAPLLAALIDVLFIPCAAWPLWRVMRQSANQRNYFLVGLLALLTITNLLFHASVLSWISLTPIAPIQAAILIIVMIESVIGTRVIPMFTRNGVPGLTPLVHPIRDQITLALLVAASLAWVIGLPAVISATVATVAASALLFRLFAWQAHRTARAPLVWILHLSYAWVPVGFYLLALAELGLVPVGAAFHALTVGSMAGLILGMMTRTSLGHTGRKLVARKIDVAMYCLIQLAAITRVLASLSASVTVHECLLVMAGICWSGAFGLFVIGYGPYLSRARIDGREG
ncbi:uncharacterized protein involved in response to NO [Oxalobacteraceae bacterium GrIS 1.18]